MEDRDANSEINDFINFFENDGGDCDIYDYCAPPPIMLIDFPPPPRPPWLDESFEAPCNNGGHCDFNDLDNAVNVFETSPNEDGLGSTFHNVVTVTVASVSIVISLLVLVAFIIR